VTYEFDGKKYETASAHQREWGEGLIAGLGLKGHEHVLDLGCGDGTLTAQIAEHVPRGSVVGLDASQGMIETALPKTRDNLEFVRQDINTLAFVDRFDVVFSNATLHWIKDHRRLLANVRQALRDGGRIRFNFAGDGNCSHFFTVIREAMAHDDFAVHFGAFEWPWYMPAVDEYRTLAESCGLQGVEVWGANADRAFPDEASMIRWVDQPSLVPFRTHVPEVDWDDFRSFVVSRMIEATKQEDGTCFETFRRVNVAATFGNGAGHRE
jgi:trans-aconitate methyltransferase